MTSAFPYIHHSITEAFTSTTQGEDPWFALGCFLHDWWCYAVDVREDLIADPPKVGETLEEKAGELFVPLQLKNFVEELEFHVPCGLANPNTYLNFPGGTFLKCLNVNG